MADMADIWLQPKKHWRTLAGMQNTDDKEKLEFMVRSTVLDRPRLLVIDPEYIAFDDQDRVSEAPTRFLKTEIEG